MLPEKAKEHISTLVGIVERLLDQTPTPYSSAKPSSFPETKGVYVITSAQGEVLRAGKTGKGNATFRERLYRNHLMGNQEGNLRAQLVGSGECSDMEQAKSWIRENCSVRYLEIDDSSTRANLEHFMLAVLQPKFCDNNKELKES
ncbi:MAG: hypothetical protein ABSC47_01965 [Terracidiphilus sp.]|jgi:hypothetical protein